MVVHNPPRLSARFAELRINRWRNFDHDLRAPVFWLMRLFRLGGTPASNVAVVNSTTITALRPAHTAGTVDVVVTNTDGQSGTKTGGFTYDAAQPAVPAYSIASLSSSLENQSFGNVIGSPSMPLPEHARRSLRTCNQLLRKYATFDRRLLLADDRTEHHERQQLRGHGHGDNIVRQLNLAGKTWKAYAAEFAVNRLHWRRSVSVR